MASLLLGEDRIEDLRAHPGMPMHTPCVPMPMCSHAGLGACFLKVPSSSEPDAAASTGGWVSSPYACGRANAAHK